MPKIFGLLDWISRNIRVLMLPLLFLGFIATMTAAQNSVVSTVTSQICIIYTVVHTAIFILGLALMIGGAALYAASHVMPGQSKSTLQGYGMGMILGGIIGVIIAEIAPFLLGLIMGSSASVASITAACS
ncbi:MAG: hypothetical protein QXW10_01215 [Candidatus Micrarchaeaceae archaeon]